MYELIQVSEQSYYIQSPAKIGLVKLNEQGVCLIDSGNDKDAGRKVRQLLNANGWRLTAIYNTHSTKRAFLKKAESHILQKGSIIGRFEGETSCTN